MLFVHGSPEERYGIVKSPKGRRHVPKGNRIAVAVSETYWTVSPRLPGVLPSVITFLTYPLKFCLAYTHVVYYRRISRRTQSPHFPIIRSYLVARA